ncbi:hypothetical protein Pdsh_02180 [Pyrodictium delaneyi]|uniref:Uncharacterized protein n=2 Tax=Pyrodictium delaneyi TaxID=1273541 RepID=A0A211YRP8_9CREN|nr:hypothetical protein Pdsh_02180 [Pyrodictium delaneyi]
MVFMLIEEYLIRMLEEDRELRELARQLPADRLRVAVERALASARQAAYTEFKRSLRAMLRGV